MSWISGMSAWLKQGEYRPTLSEDGLEELERRLIRREEPVDSTLRFGDASFIVTQDFADPVLGRGIEPRNHLWCLQFAQLVSTQDFQVFQDAECHRKLGDLSLEKLLITLGDLEQEAGNQDAALRLYHKVHELAHGAFCTNALRGVAMKENMSIVLAAQVKRSQGDIVEAAADVEGLSEELSRMVLKDLTIDEVRVLVAKHEDAGDYDKVIELLQNLNKGNINRDAPLFKELVDTLARYEHRYFQEEDFEKTQEMYNKLKHELRGAAGFHLYTKKDLNAHEENFITTGRFEALYNLIKTHAKRDTDRIVQAGLSYGQMAYEEASTIFDKNGGDFSRAQRLAQQSASILLDVLDQTGDRHLETHLESLFFCLGKTDNKAKLLEILTKHTQGPYDPPVPLLQNTVVRNIIFESPELRDKLNQYFMEVPELTLEYAKMFYGGVLETTPRGVETTRVLAQAKEFFVNAARATTPAPKETPRIMLGLLTGRVSPTDPEEVRTAIDHYNYVLELIESRNSYPQEEDFQGWIKELIRLYKISNQDTRVGSLLERVNALGVKVVRRLKDGEKVLSCRKVQEWFIPFVALLRENGKNKQALTLTKEILQSFESEIFNYKRDRRRITAEKEEELENSYKLLLSTAFSITDNDSHLNYLAAMYELRDYERQKAASARLQVADSGLAESIYEKLKVAYINAPDVPAPLENTAKRLYLASLYDFAGEMEASYSGHPFFRVDPRTDRSPHQQFSEEYLLGQEWGTADSSNEARFKAYFTEVITPRLKGLTRATNTTLLFPLDGNFHLREVATHI